MKWVAVQNEEKSEMKIFKYIDLLLVGIFSIIIGLIVLENIRLLDQIIVLNDEFGYWGNAAQLSGKNWDALMSLTPYYSYGYSLLLVPIFYFVKVPSVMYSIAILMNGAFLLIAFYCGIYILRRMYLKIDFKLATIISFCGTLYSSNLMQSQTAWTESLLYCLTMVSVCCLLNIIRKKKKLRWMIAETVILGYAYMVHQRCLVLIIAMALTFVFMALKKDIGIKELLILMLVVACCFVIQGYLKQYMLQIYDNGSLTSINDYSGQVGKLQALLSGEGLVQIIKNCIGSIFYFCISSFCIVFLGILICIKRGSGLLKNITVKNSNIVSTEYVYLYTALIVIGAVLLSGIFIYKPTRIDMVVYGRYIDYVVGPCLVIGAYEIFSNHREWKNLLFVFGCCMAFSYIVQSEIINFDVDTYNAFGSIGLCKYFFDRPKLIMIVPKMMIQTFIVFTTIYIGCWLESRAKKAFFIVGILGVCLLWIQEYNKYNKYIILGMQEYNKQNVQVITDYILNTGEDKITILYDEAEREEFEKFVANGKIKYIQFLLPDYQVNYDAYKNKESLSGYILIPSKSKYGNNFDEECILKTEEYILLQRP